MQRRMSVLIAVAATVLAIPALASAQAGNHVDIVDSAFQPDSLTVTAGEEVTWEHMGSLPHTVTSSDGAFDSSPECASFSDGGSGACLDNGETFSFTFDTPGTYTYYCKLHGTSDGGGMAGTIVVEAAGATATETASEAPSEDATEVTGAMSVSDQSGDGSVVTVDTVTINGADGFVVIHADADGAPGPVIGHAPIDEGTTTDLRVPLDTALSADATVWPMLHVDAGVLGTYEFPGADGPVSDADGVVVRPLAYTIAQEEALASTGADTAQMAALTGLALLVLIGGVALLSRRETP